MTAAAITFNELPMLATPKQAAAVMGPTEAQVRALVRDGRIAHVLVGKRVMIPRDAIERFILENTVQPCRVETQDRASTGIETEPVGISPGRNGAAAASARRARQTANLLKSPSRNGSRSDSKGEAGRVIPLRS